MKVKLTNGVADVNVKFDEVELNLPLEECPKEKLNEAKEKLALVLKNYISEKDNSKKSVAELPINDIVAKTFTPSSAPKTMKTTVTVTLPNNESLVGIATCDSRDCFVRHNGRYAAILNLFYEDNRQAESKVLNKYDNQSLFNETVEGLALASRKYYKLSRADRTNVMNTVCPLFSYNTPERRKLREKLLFNRLEIKYGVKVNPVK